MANILEILVIASLLLMVNTPFLFDKTSTWVRNIRLCVSKNLSQKLLFCDMSFFKYLWLCICQLASRKDYWLHFCKIKHSNVCSTKRMCFCPLQRAARKIYKQWRVNKHIYRARRGKLEQSAVVLQSRVINEVNMIWKETRRHQWHLFLRTFKLDKVLEGQNGLFGFDT